MIVKMVPEIVLNCLCVIAPLKNENWLPFLEVYRTFLASGEAEGIIAELENGWRDGVSFGIKQLGGSYVESERPQQPSGSLSPEELFEQ